MEEKHIDLDIRTQILGKYVPFREWFKAAPVCVDGRHGPAQPQPVTPIYPQALGGSLLSGVIRAMNQRSDQPQEEILTTINQLRDKGFPAGVHRGSHRTDTASDCGFADNLGKILKRLNEKSEEIKDIISRAAPDVMEAEVWAQVVSDADGLAGKVDFTGETLIAAVAEKCQAQVQTLEGDHAEVAAIVNLMPETTLDTGALVAANRQVFNLDLWYVLEQTNSLGLDSSYSTLA
ncbi:MAG: cadmium-containing carbonic anhydrase, partial [Candidatus Saccharimonadales bacterium]|nr:cadmium-containing carbonic anhydrase [Candidatus Saccharimonadales bacterium]